MDWQLKITRRICEKNKKGKDHPDKIPYDAIELYCPTVATIDYLNLL